MSVSLLVFALATAAPAAPVAPGASRTLYCQSQDATSGAPNAAVLVVRTEEPNFRLRTRKFVATGSGTISQAEYRGRVRAEDGTTFAFVVNRYTGEMTVDRTSTEGRVAEFSGRCRTAKF